jgi:hypothetical protein
MTDSDTSPTAANPTRGTSKQPPDGSITRYETMCTLMRKELP